MWIKLEVLAVSARCAYIPLAAAWALAVSFPLHAQDAAPTADPPAMHFSVKTVHVQGNTLLPEKELQAIVEVGRVHGSHYMEGVPLARGLQPRLWNFDVCNGGN